MTFSISTTRIQRTTSHELIDRDGIRNKGENDYKHMQFDNKDRYLLTKLMTMPESDEAKTRRHQYRAVVRGHSALLHHQLLVHVGDHICFQAR